MKIMKKLATLLLSVCLVVPCFAMSAYAADGSIQFTDPSTKVGETLELTGAIKANSGNVGEAMVNMTYDTSYLKFKSGDNVTETSAGQLKYSGNGNSSTVRFKMQFDVLKEGTTKVEVSTYNIGGSSDWDQGYSTVKIAAGENPVEPENPDEPATEEPANGGTVTINEKEYTISGEFAETQIPAGFTEATLSYDGGEYKAVKQESSNMYLAYLVDAEGKGNFFLYESEYATFAPFEQIQISETSAIALLSERGDVKLPKEYQETSITLNGFDFPAWCNAEKGDYYILYAINSQGEKTLYQYDSQEGTYQRFEAPKVVEEKKDNSFLGKTVASLKDYMNYIVLGAVILFVLFVILLIVLSVKLHNRNAELDELYDEYGIDEEDDEPVKEAKAEKKGLFKKKDKDDEDDFEDDLDSFEESAAFDDMDQLGNDFDDDFDDDDDFIGDDDFDDDDLDDDDFEDDDFDDDDFSDEDDFLEEDDFADDDDDFIDEDSLFDDLDFDFIDLDD